MAKKLIPVFLLFAANIIFAQEKSKDSLKAIINKHGDDTIGVNALVSLANRNNPFDTIFKYAQEGLALAKKINYKKGQADCLVVLAASDENIGPSIQNALDAMGIYEDLKDYVGIASTGLILQGIYRDAAGDFREALNYGLQGERVAEANNVIGKLFFPGHRLASLFLAEIGQTYILMNMPDSAVFYTQKSIDKKEVFKGSQWNFPVYLLATSQNMKGDYKEAIENYRLAKILAIQNGILRDTIQILSGISTFFKNRGQLDSAIYYAEIVKLSWNPESEVKNLLEALNNLAWGYKLRGDKDSALKYTEMSYALKDSIFSTATDREVQGISFNEQLKQNEILTTQAKYKSRIQLYALALGLLAFLLLAAILWRNSRQQKKAKIKIEHAYMELKSTQAQLVQSEKMASLGELTAGIAHEIQNPLNFVNNFSEVNSELIKEMKQEIDNENMQEVKTIADNIDENEQKILHHGKRADFIVKGMLQHSRSSTGVKEPTDINALADEYLRLAYHGLRAKDKDFNATTTTDFDTNIGKINIIPQDISRVLLNLFNNAFYACTERSRSAVNERMKTAEAAYQPTVSVETRKLNDKIEIHVQDNGGGIPEKVIDKIFQPFFTTKPTGQGTGLGLSLSYDIIKAHNGTIRAESSSGEGSIFIIQLPVA